MSPIVRSQELTKELYDSLLEKGYKYILIWDIHEENGSRNYIFVPTLVMRNIPGCSCTSIRDEMIRNIVDGRLEGISATVRIADSRGAHLTI